MHVGGGTQIGRRHDGRLDLLTLRRAPCPVLIVRGRFAVGWHGLRPRKCGAKQPALAHGENSCPGQILCPCPCRTSSPAASAPPPWRVRALSAREPPRPWHR